jgi:hypothetical protein
VRVAEAGAKLRELGAQLGIHPETVRLILRRTDDLVYRLCDELRLIVLHLVSASLGESVVPMAEPISRLETRHV